MTEGVELSGFSNSSNLASNRDTVSSSTFVLDLPGPSAYSHSSSLGWVRQGPQIGFSPSHFIFKNLQLMHAFPRLRGFKTLLGVDLDPLGVLVDIARMEKGEKESGAVALTDH